MKPAQADLRNCADEPIRIPGAVQPHGRMLVLRAQDGRLAAYSANWSGEAAAREAIQAVPLAELRLRAGEAPSSFGRLTLDGAPLEGSAHVSGNWIVLEFEPAAADQGTRAPIYSLARSFLPALQQADSVAALSRLTALEIKRITGFGRSLVYRFDAEGHGEVLAECIDEGYDSYDGHRFPADDIPSQARDLYRINHIRLIPDATYTPVDLVCVEPGLTPTAIDLSYAALRSVSPIHLEYLRNMRTLASMSVSIVVDGRLWGLISCHDHSPRSLDYAQRAACEHLGRLLSMQIDAKETTANVARRLELRRLTLEIVSHLADSDATLQRLVSEPAPLLRLADAIGAAVVLNDEVWTAGTVPAREQIAAISQWIAAREAPVVHTDRLAEVCPQGCVESEPAGVMAISISQVHRHQLIWFRPEMVQTVRWAGDPSKRARASDGRIHPRRSFSSWLQQVRGRSTCWEPEQMGAAAELRQALIGIVLRRAEEMAEVATELGRVNKELEAFSYTVSHDLRAPMRHIAGYVDLVIDAEGAKLGDRTRRYLSHVKEAAAYAGHLVDALLDFSRMGRSALKRVPVKLEPLVDEIVGELSRQEGSRVVWQVERPLPTLRADPFLMQVVLRNLMGNAVKYTRNQPEPRATVRAVTKPEGQGIEIEDNGVGFQMQYVHKLFGVFQRLHQAEDYEGTGIGLASVRRIVERHGGTVWARGEPGKGATFGFVLPTGKEE